MFGKDKSQLDQMPAFGGNYIQKSKTAARRVSTGGNAGFHWKDNWRPSDLSPDTARLIPGEYPQEVTHDGKTVVTETFPYLMCREHSTKQGNLTKTSICSAGPLFRSIFGAENQALPCNCCPIWAEDVKMRQAKKAAGDNTKGPNRMGLRDMFAFNVWDYGLWFQVPDKDKRTGQFRMNPRTNQPYYTWRKGNPNDPAMQGLPWKQGHLAPWFMGKTHKETLINYGEQVIGKMCKTCGTRDSIVTVVKMCGNPACGQYIYDPNSTTLSEEQRRQIDYYPYTCSYCKQTGYVDEVIECNNPGCSQPERSTIFDVDLVLQRMKSGDGNQTVLQILNFSEPRPIQVTDPEILKTIKPLDLAKKFGPTSLDAQLRIHNIQGQPAQGTTVAVDQPPPFTAPMAAAPSAMAGATPQYPQQPGAQPGVVMQPPGVPPHVQTLQAAPPAQPAMPPMGPPQVAIPTAPQQLQLPAAAPQAPPAQPQPLSAVPAVPYQVQPPQAGTDE